PSQRFCASFVARSLSGTSVLAKSACLPTKAAFPLAEPVAWYSKSTPSACSAGLTVSSMNIFWDVAPAPRTVPETSAMGYGFSAAAVVESPESACGVSLPEQAVKASPPANRVAKGDVVCWQSGASIKYLLFSIVEAAFHCYSSIELRGLVLI